MGRSLELPRHRQLACQTTAKVPCPSWPEFALTIIIWHRVEKNTTEKSRHCGCKCRQDCECTCPCPHYCICATQCLGTCHKNAAKSQSKVRNLVVSIDGTSNQFGTNNTNVVELHSRIIKDSDEPHPQLTFYTSGIGTYVPPSLRSIAYWKQSIGNKIDLAIAWNFKKQVQHAYRWLADHYRPGDVIYLFGFSRGAYQVRTLAGMITTVGLVYSGNQRLIPFAYELYAKRHKGKGADELCMHFKKTFSRPAVRVHFVGAWYDRDTVSSVGIFRGQPLPLTTSADHICHFRHALALDERRVRFLPEYVHSAVPKAIDIREDKGVWFAGTHSDILDLAGVPLLWMENEATSAGLHLDPRNEVWKWEEIKRDEPIESLKGPFWWFLEKIRLTRSTYNVDKPEETTSYELF
ncbi:hypothetical protein B0H13DRAFT_1618356 [Mycena leptocephala]|nr:hypothetical protein B0H13DRAFT_1618356 [Mycena leptocephala]